MPVLVAHQRTSGDQEANRTHMFRLAGLGLFAQGIYYAYIGCLFTGSPQAASAPDELKSTPRRVASALCPDKEDP